VLFCSASADAQNRIDETVLPSFRGSILGRGRPPRPFSFPFPSGIFSSKVDANRKRERKQADRLWSQYIRLRDRDTCQRCWKPGNHPHHIFSRRHLGTRWEPMNGILLCAGCHRFVAHVDYEEIRSLVIRKIGVEAFQGLRIRAMTITKADEAMAIITLKCLISEGKKNNAGMQGAGRRSDAYRGAEQQSK